MKLRLNSERKDEQGIINRIIDRYHFESKDREDLCTIYNEVCDCISPYAIYKINTRVTGVKKIDENDTALVAITLGIGPDMLMERYTKEGCVREAYITECISNEILMSLYEEFNASYSRIHRRYVSGYVFVGEEIPLTKMQEFLLSIQEMDENSGEPEIFANEFGVMKPSKSVLFYAILTENPRLACAMICTNCGNKECEYKECGCDNLHNVNANDDKIKLNYGYQRIFGVE